MKKTAIAIIIAAVLINGLLSFAVIKLYLQNMQGFMNGSEPTGMRLSLSSNEGVFYPNDTAKIEIELFPRNAALTGIAWSSSDEAVAAVDSNGNVSFKSVGGAVIKAVLDNGVEAEIEVEAKKKPYRLSLGESSVQLAVNNSVSLNAVVVPEDAVYEGILFESSDRSVVRVDQDGRATGVSQGRATVRATVAGNVICEVDFFVYKFKFDLLNDHIIRNGTPSNRSGTSDENERYITLGYTEQRDNEGRLVCRHTYISYFPGSDQTILYTDVYDENDTFFYETLVYFERNNKTSASFEFYCYAEKTGGGSSWNIPLAAVGALNVDAFGKLSMEDYHYGDEVDFYKYEGDEGFRDTALELAKNMLSQSLRSLSDYWGNFETGCSITEVIGFKNL